MTRRKNDARDTARTKKTRRTRLLLSILLIVLAAVIVQSDWLGRFIYPISYVQEIKQGANEYKLDPLLVAAIIRVESNYKPDARSKKGALGIMQIMPETVKWIIKQEDFGDISLVDVGEKAHAGIALGSWYIKELLRQFDGDLTKVLAAYNAGPGKVRQWVGEGVWDGSEQQIRNIPYGETRHYVQRVLYYYKKYQKLYETL
ncbi:MAG: lytic transglycosylase domain-containing protein [Candidatus Cohnella colombiensis]|uniref:Lytic transglycosylase domain-containing protein n=1 Tax=Candidatus Cohnella colombiensis TaxID=3121368 RepID=A0AA95F1W9_9BACL|nr:MAG: lytic transglycosylase domain-containing protein [Cohnella sp.]